MKFSIDIECTPQEARAFLGLPDVEAFQRDLMELINERTTEHLKSLDPETLLKTWLPMGSEGLAAMQKAFMKSLGAMTKPSGE